MPAQLTAFGCVAYTPTDGLLVGGRLHPSLAAQTAVYTYDRTADAFTAIGDLEEATSNIACGSKISSNGTTLVLCTGGQTDAGGDSVKTYALDVAGKKLVTRAEWDLPAAVEVAKVVAVANGLSVTGENVAYEFVEDGEGGVFWEQVYEIVGYGVPVAVQLDFLQYD